MNSGDRATPVIRSARHRPFIRTGSVSPGPNRCAAAKGAETTTSLLFVAPLVRALSGLPDPEPKTETVVLGRDVGPNDQRQDYLRARLVVAETGLLTAVPADLQDSSLLTRFASTDGLIVRPPHAPAARAGETTRFVRFP